MGDLCDNDDGQLDSAHGMIGVIVVVVIMIMVRVILTMVMVL